MRVPDDIPQNPWPSDMVIGVEECWEPLVFLLFVRTAWHLDIPEVPKLEVEPDVGLSSPRWPPEAPAASEAPDASDASEAVPSVSPPIEPAAPVDPAALWRSDWARAWGHFAPSRHAVARPTPDIQQLLNTLTDEELWAATSTWPSPFWDAGIDRVAYEVWRETLPAPAGELPEHRVIEALTAAWRSGLTTIVVLPYAGYFAERINEEHLVVSASTRMDPGLFSRALSAPRPAD
jgi:hypothetical protein